MNDFSQSPPELGNQFTEDALLRAYLDRVLDPETTAAVMPQLKRLGALAAGELLELAHQAESQPPRHIPYDAWGNRVDRIETSPAWRELKRHAAELGIVATGYERTFGPLSRVVQFALLYLYHPSSAVYSCPLAMTDGAARAIECHGDAFLRLNILPRLTSRDPARFWTSGQWMTERSGGSDVSGTGTIARVEDGVYRLYGTKWFTSATTSEMAMTLARIEHGDSQPSDLSLFFLELRQSNGAMNGIQVNRLKDKLGTRALPTAELTLHGAHARLIGGPGGGVRKISSLFNITRIYNAICAVGYMRRALALAGDYAQKRRAFGQLLKDHPLHRATLADLALRFRACFLLTFYVCELLGRQESGPADAAESSVLRLLTPIAKLFTGKESIAVCSEALECFGGAGYIEDTHLPELLRNTQVLSIWEGTTNILSLDVLRAIAKNDSLTHFAATVSARLAAITQPELEAATALVTIELKRSLTFFGEVGGSGTAIEIKARTFAMNLAWVACASLLLEQGQWEAVSGRGKAGLIAAQRWCRHNPYDLSRTEIGRDADLLGW